MEVTGRVGRDWLFASDIVLAIDMSSHALLASGFDVDEDGDVGETKSWAEDGGGVSYPHAWWTSLCFSVH